MNELINGVDVKLVLSLWVMVDIILVLFIFASESDQVVIYVFSSPLKNDNIRYWAKIAIAILAILHYAILTVIFLPSILILLVACVPASIIWVIGYLWKLGLYKLFIKITRSKPLNT